MCGIFGVLHRPWSYDPQNRIAGLAKSLAISSESRGVDSTGVVVINKNDDGGELYIAKDSQPAQSFVESNNFKKVLDKVGKSTFGIIGHTRAATNGDPRDNRNNHPHICGSIVGVHNGNIRNWRELAKEYQLQLNGNCDSEVIFALIDQMVTTLCISVQDAIVKTAALLSGPFACCLLSTQDVRKVYLFRNNAPIIIKHKLHGNIVLFASEKEVIFDSIRNSGLNKDKLSNYFSLNEYFLPNAHGMVLQDAVGGYSTDWIEQAKTFTL